jgi:hypothetical protein
LNTLLPVIANSVEFLPSNLSESFANRDVDDDTAFDVVPLMVALIPPKTVRVSWNVADPDTVRDPEMFASNIFIWLYCYTLINT